MGKWGGNELGAPHRRRIALTLLWALPLAILLDSAIGWAGDRLSHTLYSEDTAVPVMLADQQRQIDLLIVGGCRAALGIDPATLGRSLGGIQVFNAGKRAEGLGNAEFTAYVGLSHHRPKTVVIVLDDGNLRETLDVGRADAQSKTPWLGAMTPAYRQQFLSIYSPPVLNRFSGLWRYRGQGRQLATAGIDTLLHKPVQIVDGYVPRPADQNITAAIKSDQAGMTRDILRSIEMSGYSRGVVARIVAAARASGAQPVLVVVPMHYFRATDAVNARQQALVAQLARENDVPALFYPDNHSSFAHADQYWSDSGHMNRLGAEHFTPILARDLSALLARKDDLKGAIHVRGI